MFLRPLWYRMDVHKRSLVLPSMAPFFVIWIGQAFSLLGSQLVQFTLVWWLTKETGSATVLAFATLMAVLPQIFLGPFAGALVDRWNRRVVMILSDGAIAVSTVILVLLFAHNCVQVWHIYALMLVRSAGAAFHWPAMQASTTLMVPEKYFARIAGLNETLFGVANIMAPPLAAVLLGLFPMQTILSIDVGTAIIAILPLCFIPVPQPEQQHYATPEDRPSLFDDMKEGIQFLWGWPGMLLLVGMFMVTDMLYMPIEALTPLLVTDHFHGNVYQLAWLEAAWGGGVVVGGILFSVWGGFKQRIVTGMLALVCMGIGTVVIGVVPPSGYTIALGGLFLAGFMEPILNGSLIAVLQSNVPPRLQGRVLTLLMSSISAMMPISLLVAGPFVDAFNVQTWYLLTGVVTCMLGGAAFFVPTIMQIERQTQQAFRQPVGDAHLAPDSQLAPVAP